MKSILFAIFLLGSLSALGQTNTIDPGPGGGGGWQQTWYHDPDGDGYGNDLVTTQSDQQPLNYTWRGGDCDSGRSSVYPGAPEVCDGLDNDCDGQVDEGSLPPLKPSAPTVSSQCNETVVTRGNPPNGIIWYWQESESGTSTLNSNSSITRTSGTVVYLRAKSGSCWSAARRVDYLIRGERLWYTDSDNDGLGDPNSLPIGSCFQPTGRVSNNLDNCPGTSGTVNGCPVAVEDTGLDRNYIHTTTYRIPTTSGSVSNPTDKMESITYFDGLGRPEQSIQARAGGGRENIIQHIKYDDFGRQEKQYLPYPTQAEVTNGTLDWVDPNQPQGMQAQISYYTNEYPEDFTGALNPYSEKKFDSSPLNRVLKQAAPGSSWAMGSGHEIEMDYQTNATNEVRMFGVDHNTDTDGAYAPSLTGQSGSYYTAGTLYKNITRDENHVGSESDNDHTVEEFTDRQGRVVLKRTYESEVAHDTYYIYDDYGNLTYVIPPLASAGNSFTTTVLEKLCYTYRYDYRNRLIKKRIPGKAPEEIVYDKLDRPILTRDANLEVKEQWLFTKYDALGRVAYTGLLNSSDSRKQHQTNATASTSLYESRTSVATPASTEKNMYYTTNSYPSDESKFTILTIQYYDDLPSVIAGNRKRYDMANGTNTYTTAMTYDQRAGYSFANSESNQGLPVLSEVRILGMQDWTTTATYYDKKGRAVMTAYHNDYTQKSDRNWMNIDDFTGRVIYSMNVHQNSGSPNIAIRDIYTYDHMDRILKHEQVINGNDPEKEVIVENTYDAMGQLESKGVGGKHDQTRLQDVDFDYNVRGWLTDINKINTLGTDLFSFNIGYDSNQHGTTINELFNGNIGETRWKTANDNIERHYNYEYDALNRITEAQAWNADYNLNNVYYDPNGNITALYRDAPGTGTSFMDALTYTYDGNRLTNIRDFGYLSLGFKSDEVFNNGYTYDANGNMTSDEAKKIGSITYNHLNLPEEIVFIPEGNETYKKINYTYDSNGTKLIKSVSTLTSTQSFPIGGTSYTEYSNGFIYEGSHQVNQAYQGAQLKFFSHPEGYTEKNGSSFDYVYQYKDHLGNIRLAYSDKNGDGDIDVTTSPFTTEIIQENNYYPFGLEHKGYNNISNNANSAASKFKYNGKELNEELGLDWYDYGARNYDASLGRWMNIDPLAEKYYTYNPYMYAANNPVYYIDPDGQQIIIHYQDEDGNDKTHTYEYGKEYKGDNQFVSDIYESFNYLIDNDADTTGVIKALSGKDLGDVDILQNNEENNDYSDNPRMKSFYSSNDNELIFDPTQAVEVTREKGLLSWLFGEGYEDEVGVLSPAEVLLHELGHAQSALEDLSQHKIDSNSLFTDYENREEFDVISTIENPAAEKLNHVKRNNHNGRFVKVNSPTSTTPANKKKK